MRTTTPSRWQRVQELCEAVEALPAGEQLARLRALEPDEGLRRETRELLQALRDEAAYRPAPGEPEHELEAEPPPATIGGVRIEQRLGSGGTGEVFRGVRSVHGSEQPVAVKLFHAHRAGAEDRDRFVREQRLLATLTHPDIVRLLDAGLTADGRPYLVMELAAGEPITAYCDARRLPLAARLRLFLAVCDAVQSAHRHLIVHLDLKPSNVLVSGEDGRVKLLDFGAAKLADPDAGVTRTEPLTLLYASPERLRGEPVSVACDVWSLGLILCELAAGGWPFPRATSLLAVAERAAGNSTLLPLSRLVSAESAAERDAAPERLRAALRGDLEAIVAKALAHEPAHRYATVADLAEDVRRHLAGEPVRAHAPGVAYVLGKLVRRHAWPVTSVLLLICGLAAAAVYSAAQARASRLAARHAQTQSRFLSSIFTLAGNDAASRADMTVRELLALAEMRIAPVLGGDAATAGDVEVALAEGYLSQHAPAEARRLLERAIERAAGTGDVPREAVARASLAYVAYLENRNEEAGAGAQAALALWRRHPRRFTLDQAVATLSSTGATLSYLAPTDPAPREPFAACLEIARAAAPGTIDGLARARCLRGLAMVYATVDSRYEEADALLGEAAELLRGDHTAGSWLANTLQIRGLVNRYQGRFAEDEAAQREAYEIVVRLRGAGSTEALWQRAVWVVSLTGVGRGEEARRAADEVLAAARRIYPQPGSYLLWTPLFAAASASCLDPTNTRCEALAREALDTLGPRPVADDPRLHSARGLLGLAWARQGRLAEARPLLEGALAMEAQRHRRSAYSELWRAALGAGGALPGTATAPATNTR